MKARAARLLAAVAGALLLVCALYGCVTAVALDEDRYPRDGALGEAAQEVLDYLRGRLDAMAAARFTQRERLHMEDVRALFDGARRLALGCLAAAAALGTAGALLGGRRTFGRGLLYGVAAFAGCFALLGLWALADFDGWFTAMHRLAFSNDLWLLPADSTLITLMPLSFFMQAVAAVAARFLSCMAAVVALGWDLSRARRRERET